MANTSANELAQDVLQACLYDGTWPARSLDRLIERALDEDEPAPALAATRALFGVVIERLADLFEPALCDVYARLFSHVIGRALPQYEARDLLVRYRQIRQGRPWSGGEVRKVFVLSRITLGADVAITSVALQAALTRFPDAEICFVGPQKNGALFEADPQITLIPFEYQRRNFLRARLQAGLLLRPLVDEPGTIVLDLDSRLTQLGLIPICDDARYYFFESRSYGEDSRRALPQLTAEWLQETLHVPQVRPFVAPESVETVPDITVSLGVGENQEKRLSDKFEEQLLRMLCDGLKLVVLDRGAGGEEAERVDTLAARLHHPPNLRLHDGPYASFAAHIVRSRLYVGYDSAGQHVAAAARVPFLSIFKGFASERMFLRWRPSGPNGTVIQVQESDSEDAVMGRVAEAIAGAAAER